MTAGRATYPTALALAALLVMGLPGAPALSQPQGQGQLQSPAQAEQALARTIAGLETRLEARIGIMLREAGGGRQWGHRADERFLMASTFKSVLCGAILAGADRGALSLDEELPIRAGAVHGHAPVTRDRIGQRMRIDGLCQATLDQSDNGAANLLIERLGGPAALTAFMRAIGDPVTRLDRMEPELNSFVPGDPRDTTSPAAITASWEALLLGDALSPGARALLADWMRPGGVTGALIRPHVPAGWDVADRSGGGRSHTRNIVAMLTPPGQRPWLVAIYLSDTPANWSTRNAAVSDLGAAVVALIAAQSPATR